MNLLSPELVLQLVAWILSLLGFVLALYILLLNVSHTANHHVSGLLLLSALNSLGLGILVAADSVSEAIPGTYLLAITGIAIVPSLLIVAIQLLKPEWMQGRWRWAWSPLYALALIPLLLVAMDIVLGTRFMYTGLDPNVYSRTGGYVGGKVYMATTLYRILNVAGRYAVGALAVVPLGYIALFDRKVDIARRRLAWLLLGIQIVAVGLQAGSQAFLPIPVAVLIATGLYIAGYGYAGFQQMISARRTQRGRLQIRLTLLVVAITIPAFVAVSGIVGTYTGVLLRERAFRDLGTLNRGLSANVSTWLDLNVRALQQLALLPDIASMEAARQRPALEAMAAAHPHMYLVSTTDLSGANVARNDGAEAKDYSDRAWFAGARDGAAVTYQSLVGKTSGEPALVVSVPIRQGSQVVGVAMFASTLTDIASEVSDSHVGDTGYAYVLDDQNRAIAHPDRESSQELRDLTYEGPVIALRRGEENPVLYEDGEGNRWFAHVSAMDNGWGVVVQQQEADLLIERRPLLHVAWTVVAVGSVVLVLLTWLTVRQAFRPIESLIETATGITEGDLTRVAPVESEDEIGVLARAFNRMTEQLRELIGGLEQRVRERTADLESRSSYLTAAAEVSRAAASILDPDELIQRTVELIRERFSLYYVGLFLVDESRQWAMLRAGTGDAGRQMLARGHRLEVGGGSMIGRCVEVGRADVQLDVGEAAVRFDNPLLPATRSELALPLRSREQVIGAMTVQSDRPVAFDGAYVAVLQTRADQGALAIDTARLLRESTVALEETRRVSGERMGEAWVDLLRTRPDWGYRYAGGRVVPVSGAWSAEMAKAAQVDRTLSSADVRVGGDEAAQNAVLAIPLRVREQVVGVLGFRKRGSDQEWTSRETEVLEALVEQMGDALVAAQLYEAAQDNAAREQLVGELATRMRQTLDVESVLRTAVQEVRQALDLSEVVVRLRSGSDHGSEGQDDRAQVESLDGER